MLSPLWLLLLDLEETQRRLARSGSRRLSFVSLATGRGLKNSTHFYRNEFVVLTVPGENPEYAATFNRNFIQLPLDDLFDYEDESLLPFET